MVEDVVNMLKEQSLNINNKINNMLTTCECGGQIYY